MAWKAKLSPEEVAARAVQLRAALSGTNGIAEKKMFGGICFMLRDHMLCGTGKQGYLFRVGAAGEAEALSRPGAERMAHAGREYVGYLWVDPKSCDAKRLGAWVALATRFVEALPPKGQKSARVVKKRRG
jgi:hypothetical protein